MASARKYIHGDRVWIFKGHLLSPYNIRSSHLKMVPDDVLKEAIFYRHGDPSRPTSKRVYTLETTNSCPTCAQKTIIYEYPENVIPILPVSQNLKDILAEWIGYLILAELDGDASDNLRSMAIQKNRDFVQIKSEAQLWRY